MTAGDALPARLRARLRESALIEPGRPVAVAVSGGLDSVALLHLLRFHPPDGAGALTALHFDHAMRPGSDGDARWVGGLCRAWAVPLVAGRAETPPRSEAEARDARYRFLLDAAPVGALVATAHHADDQAETVLFRLARGTGLRGLRGIAPRRGRIVRPLLPFTRRELERYARASGLRHREDPTNRELRFARNRVRHAVMPALEAVRPGAARALAGLAAEARRAERAWERALAGLAGAVVVEEDGDGVTLARDILRSYHAPLQARVFRHLLRRYGTAPGRAGTRAALEFINTGRSGGSMDLPGGVRLERDFDRIRIVPAAPAAGGDAALEIPDRGPGAGRAVVGGRALEVWWGGGAGAGAVRAVVAEPRLPLCVRGWRPGDRIRMAYGTKKLKKLFAERRMDRRARRATPLLVDAAGRVLWVVGVAMAEGVDVDGAGLEVAVTDAVV